MSTDSDVLMEVDQQDMSLELDSTLNISLNLNGLQSSTTPESGGGNCSPTYTTDGKVYEEEGCDNDFKIDLYGPTTLIYHENEDDSDDSDSVTADSTIQSSDNSSGLGAMMTGSQTIQAEVELALREYQSEICRRSLDGCNDIIILPTGTGKTYVAIKIINEHLLNQESSVNTKKRKIVFMAPTNVLVHQQFTKITRYVLPRNTKCTKLTGELNLSRHDLERRLDDDSTSVFVVTPQIFVDCIVRTKRVNEFSLLLFDEYHHSKKKHPYKRILLECMGSQESITPQLVGLTASVGIGDSDNLDKAKEHILIMCAQMNLTKPPSQVIENKENLAKLTNMPSEGIAVVESSVSGTKFSQLVNKLIKSVEESIYSELKVPDLKDISEAIRRVSVITNKTTTAYINAIKNALCLSKTRLNSGLFDKVKVEITNAIEGLRHLEIYWMSLLLVDMARATDGYKYLETKLGDELKRIHDLPGEATTAFGRIYLDQQEELERIVKEEQRREMVSKEPVNPKLKELKKQLLHVMEKDGSSKILVFVCLRSLAGYLCEWIKEWSDDLFLPMSHTSHRCNKDAGGSERMESDETLAAFSSGKCNLLIATSVLEEGFDKSDCNAVIRYMYIKDVISKIQARGRVRAMENGQLICVVDQQLKKQEEDNDAKEKMMGKAVEAINNMPLDEFTVKMKELREAQLQQAFVRPAAVTTKPVVAAVARPDITCSHCDGLLCNLSDVRCYQDQYHLVLDTSMVKDGRMLLHPPSKEDKDMRNGITGKDVLICAKCEKERHLTTSHGRLISINNIIFPMLKLKKRNFQLKGYAGRYGKWSEVKRDHDLGATLEAQDLFGLREFSYIQE